MKLVWFVLATVMDPPGAKFSVLPVIVYLLDGWDRLVSESVLIWISSPSVTVAAVPSRMAVSPLLQVEVS
mgnify:CR=1 FL=1